MLPAMKEKQLTPVERAIEAFESKNGFSFTSLREPAMKARFMRYGGDIRDHGGNELLNKALKLQRKLIEEE